LSWWRGGRYRGGKIRENVWTVGWDKKVAVAVVERLLIGENSTVLAYTCQ